MLLLSIPTERYSFYLFLKEHCPAEIFKLRSGFFHGISLNIQLTWMKTFYGTKIEAVVWI